MSLHLICTTSTGGIPLFTKKKGDCDNLPFSTIGSLNGVHMFCKSQNIDLQVTYMNDGLVMWKEYEQSILLIIISKGFTEKVLKNLLDLIYNSMILTIGINEFRNSKNLEKFKRDIRSSLPIVDVLLDSVETELLLYSDSILCPENYEILCKVNEFSEQIGSPFCFVMIRQKIAVATEGFWTLHVTDRKLIISLLNASSTPQKDTPIFLPEKNPTIAYRLVSVPLLQGVNVCALCGIEPSYNDLENIAQLVWKNDLEALQLAEQCYPRNFPTTFQLDPSILGILLINKLHEKYVISRNIQMSNSGKRTISGNHRLDILRIFFHQNVDIINEFINPSNQNNVEDDLIKSNESYWCSDYHKCHSLEDDDNLICILYTASIPTHTMRFITKRTLQMITSDKEICW